MIVKPEMDKSGENIVLTIGSTINCWNPYFDKRCENCIRGKAAAGENPRIDRLEFRRSGYGRFSQRPE